MEVEELALHGYVELDVLEHDRILPFVRTYLAKPVRSKWVYLLVNVIPLCFTSGLIGLFAARGTMHWSASIGLCSVGLFLAFLLIPLHEYIHVLAYRSQGAKATSYAADLRRFTFMALADHFVADRRAFRIVVSAPFVVISMALVVPMFFVPDHVLLVLLGSLIVHTACCSGDFGLLAYFDHHRDKDVVTYDDVAEKRSYFYGRVRSGVS